MSQLALSHDQHATLWTHLLQEHGEEEAAFAFVSGNSVLRPSHIVLAPVSAYVYKSRFGFELSDEFRGSMIKEAHDRNAIIIEFHSHPFPGAACFSRTDVDGLREFVPHVRWRLKGKPYGALVVAPDNFDGLYWQTTTPEPLSLSVDGTTLLPTRKTMEEW